MVKSKLSPSSGSAALRQLNLIHKRDNKVFFKDTNSPFKENILKKIPFSAMFLGTAFGHPYWFNLSKASWIQQ